jgi:hypothetical protein
MMGIRGAVTLLLCALPLAAWGQSLPDPTRPPNEIGDGAVSGAQRPAANAKGLLSVIISPARCAAIIDGKLVRLGEHHGGAQLVEISASGVVRLGERHGGAQLVEITASGVVLQGPGGRRSMALFPGVGVKVTEPDSPPRKGVGCTLENQKNMKKSPGKAGLEEKK